MSDTKQTKTVRIETSVILERAKVILSDPEVWIKGDLAVDEVGDTTYPAAKGACKFCMIGAFSRAISDLRSEIINANDSDQRLIITSGHSATEAFKGAIDAPVVIFNDAVGTTHQDVMKAFDKAIAIIKSEENLLE